jgi:hypothetical protein
MEGKKEKLSCYMPWRHMGERRYSSYSYLTSALNGGEWSASRPGWKENVINICVHIYP